MDFTNQNNHANVQRSLSLNYRCEPMQNMTPTAAKIHFEVAVAISIAGRSGGWPMSLS